MKIKSLLTVFCTLYLSAGCLAQPNASGLLAKKFISSFNTEQRSKAIYAFSSDERYNWHFIPKQDRIGIKLNELSKTQKELALKLLKTYLSEKGYQKTMDIIQLELVLHRLENRPEGSWNRDPGRYSLTFFGTPAHNHAWGWRFEGHHVSFSFSSINNKIVSSTPGFMGSNPAIVLSGPQKGKQVLKDEATLGFMLIHSLLPQQLAKALIANEAPNGIITHASRKAMIEKPQGIFYSDLDKEQKDLFMQLLSIYINRYTPKFADDMMQEIEEAGLDRLQFAWSGAQQEEIGKAHYYRIQGPSIIIEYDNSQNNANHVHTVVRDLKHDFGGDELLKHYQKKH